MNNLEQPQEPQYWDVFPKLIRVSRSPFVQRIPLSIRGLPEVPVFESSNPDVASVDEDGNVECGFVPGAAMILVWIRPSGSACVTSKSRSMAAASPHRWRSLHDGYRASL